MSIENMSQRLASGETIQATNPDNGLQFDVVPHSSLLGGYQTYDIYVNGQHRQCACVPVDCIDEWASGIEERGK